ncbi:hypothetical protein BX600DRAFT_507514 [Xylariales sp. PMI_506]|nr:hypothetical protein BX600DRAFT_507514 [Xylariales sp. PMI_506]
MSANGQGIPPQSAQGGIHNMARGQEQQGAHHSHHQHNPTGLTDEAVRAEQEFVEGVERRASQGEGGSNIGSKIKEGLKKLAPGNNKN